MTTNSGPDHKWVAVFRIVTLSLVLSLGGFGCFVLLGGLLLDMTPFEPPGGVSFEDHMHRLHTGYYTDQGWKELGIILTYLTVVAIPHRWIVRSRVSFLSAIIVLALPLLAYLGNFMVAAIRKRHDTAALIEMFHPLNVLFDSVCILFCLMIPLSLLFSWKVRHRGDKCVQSTT